MSPIPMLVALAIALPGAWPARVRAADAHAPGSPSSPVSVPPTALRGVNALPCGRGFCDSTRQYCETIKTDAPQWPTDYACMPLPPACRAAATGATANCGCFPAGTRCDFCSAVGPRGSGTGFYRTCVGGR